MLGISGTELVIILFFGFLIFGPDKLPQIGRTVGRAIRQFREASEAANQKFKEEVYDPFKDAVEPYAEQLKESGAPLKEDLDAINSTLKETQDMFKDPFGLKDEGKKKDAADAAQKQAEEKTPGIKSMVDDMLHDPFDMKKNAAADEAADEQGPEDAPAASPVEAQPLPDTGGTVKTSFADSLYGLGQDSAPSAAKNGE